MTQKGCGLGFEPVILALWGVTELKYDTVI